MRILILCTGNSCRSQMAHGILQATYPEYEIHSAGTSPAERVNPRAIEVLKEIAIDISDHYPKSVDIYLDQQWDYVITVCGGANETCPTFTGHVKHRLHIGFEDPSEAHGDETFIMDEFRRIRDQIKSALAHLPYGQSATFYCHAQARI